ncbi:MAG: beta-propeller domain-containing protein [Woeseiaceae bacterium]|nr:beta-propeller domain-containing protein [Woeseiaceae bacterium]
MHYRLAGFALSVALLAGCASIPSASGPESEPDQPGLDSITRDSLERFRNRSEFDEYLTDLRYVAGEYDMWWALRRANPGASLLAQEDDLPCVPGEPGCEVMEEAVVVTGSRITRQSITNNQEIGVDEGDIVKLYKDFLIVLQDGRLFSVTIGDSASDMSLVDRIDIYSSPLDDIWYDELLITGNKLIVTGFNYGDGVTDISIFSISDDGVFEWLSTYEITSDDYYSSDNYATRMVDDQLVIYTPLYLADYGLDEGVVFPVYRQRFRNGRTTFWRPLFKATDLYWPIQQTLNPVVHTVSICPITQRQGLDCRSFGAIGPESREWYVSPDHAYLWVSQDHWDLRNFMDISDCESGPTDDAFEPLPATVYRVPLQQGRMTAARAAGAPRDQFALDARDDRLLALVKAEPFDCEIGWGDLMPMRLARIDTNLFDIRPQPVVSEDYAVLPPVRRWWYENRFTEEHVVYSDVSDGEFAIARWARSDLVVAPLDNAQLSSRVPLTHGVRRLETLGDGVVAAGYLDRDGLHISTIGISESPTVVDTEFLFGFYESEGRSHAFNWHLEEDGSGIFGLPMTVKELVTWGQYSWMAYRDRADLGFFEVQPDLSFSHAGFLHSTEPEDSDYECDVSCIDWYGNARPIFLDGRIFALSGTELIEGQLMNGSIQELGRVQLTGRPAVER